MSGEASFLQKFVEVHGRLAGRAQANLRMYKHQRHCCTSLLHDVDKTHQQQPRVHLGLEYEECAAGIESRKRQSGHDICMFWRSLSTIARPTG